MARSGRWEILVVAAPRSCFRGLTRGQRGFKILGAVRRFFQEKALRFGANGGDACGCRNPIGGAVVVTFSLLKLRVKTLDHRGLDDGGVVCHFPLGGIVVEL
jgi:hypothetical protein